MSSRLRDWRLSVGVGEILRELSMAERLRNSELRPQGKMAGRPLTGGTTCRCRPRVGLPVPHAPGVAFCQVLLWSRGEPRDVASQVEAPAQAEAESRDPAPHLPSWVVTHGLSPFL